MSQQQLAQGQSNDGETGKVFYTDSQNAIEIQRGVQQKTEQDQSHVGEKGNATLGGSKNTIQTKVQFEQMSPHNARDQTHDGEKGKERTRTALRRARTPCATRPTALRTGSRRGWWRRERNASGSPATKKRGSATIPWPRVSSCASAPVACSSNPDSEDAIQLTAQIEQRGQQETAQDQHHDGETGDGSNTDDTNYAIQKTAQLEPDGEKSNALTSTRRRPSIRRHRSSRCRRKNRSRSPTTGPTS